MSATAEMKITESMERPIMLRALLSTDTSSSCSTKLQCSMIIKWNIVVLISTLNLIEIIRVMIFSVVLQLWSAVIGWK